MTTQQLQTETTMNLEFFGERVYYARKVLNDFSLTQVGHAINANRTTIQIWEKSKDRIGTAKSNNLWAFCKYCGVEFQWVLTGTGPIKQERPIDKDSSTTLPLIKWEDIELLKTGGKPKALGDAEAPVYLGYGERSAITTVPVQMLAEFNKGDRIIIDPDLTPDNGQYLIYSFNEQATIVTYIELSGGRKHISPLTEQAGLENYDPKKQLAVIKGKWY